MRSPRKRNAVMVLASPQHCVTRGIRSRHDTAMEAELEAAKLRSMGYKAYARDFDQEHAARAAERKGRTA
jgi:hypothetical protein